MKKSVWKVGSYLIKYKNYRKLYKRNLLIGLNDLGLIFKIHNGNALITRYIDNNMLNYKYGELSVSRRFTNKFLKIKQQLLNRQKDKKNNKKK